MLRPSFQWCQRINPNLSMTKVGKTLKRSLLVCLTIYAHKQAPNNNFHTNLQLSEWQEWALYPSQMGPHPLDPRRQYEPGVPHHFWLPLHMSWAQLLQSHHWFLRHSQQSLYLCRLGKSKAWDERGPPLWYHDVGIHLLWLLLYL